MRVGCYELAVVDVNPASVRCLSPSRTEASYHLYRRRRGGRRVLRLLRRARQLAYAQERALPLIDRDALLHLLSTGRLPG